jgi:hypothetical protein
MKGIGCAELARVAGVTIVEVRVGDRYWTLVLRPAGLPAPVDVAQETAEVDGVNGETVRQAFNRAAIAIRTKTDGRDQG